MLILIAFCIFVIMLCFLIAEKKCAKRNVKKKFIKPMLTILGGLAAIVFVLMISMSVALFSTINADEQITLYEQNCELLQNTLENPEQLSDLEIQYLQEMYDENMQKINDLEFQKAGISKLKWLLFFGE